MGAASLEECVTLMTKPRAIWLMLPATVVDKVLAKLLPLLEAGDIVVDGGNSYYRDDIRRASELQQHGVHYLDVGSFKVGVGVRVVLTASLPGKTPAKASFKLK